MMSLNSDLTFKDVTIELMLDRSANHIVSPLSLGIIFVFATILTFITNGSLLLEHFLNYNAQSAALLLDEQGTRTANFLQNVNNFPLTPIIVTTLVWGIVGLIAFIVSNYVMQSISEIKEDVEVSIKYVHPKHFKQSAFWLSILLHFFYTIFTVTLVTIWTVFSFSILIPFTSIMVILSLYNSDMGTVPQIALFVVAIGTWTLVLFGYFVVAKILKSSISK